MTTTETTKTGGMEIRVALLGHVSVGKTTILNALLRDKFSEVAMRRTTAAVNLFRTATKEEGVNGDDKMEEAKDDKETKVSSDKQKVEFRSAVSTMEEITRDNKRLRDDNSGVEEKLFDVELFEALCDMRKDTKLVIVDIPGINEAGTNNKYTKYVSDNWHKFDCVVLVMDGRQGVNTNEQIRLLEFVKRNASNGERKIPLIILCNKIDEPEQTEQRVLMTETREAVERIFEVSDREKALTQVIEGELKVKDEGFSPVFVPISAMQGFIFQSGSLLSFENFNKHFDKDLMEQLGRNAFGWEWKNFSDEDKMKKAFDLVSDPAQYKKGIEASNFHRFLGALKACVGGDEVQLDIIKEQLKLLCEGLSKQSGSALGEVRRIHQISSVLSVEPTAGQLFDLFWGVHKKMVNESFSLFMEPSQVSMIAAPMNEIIKFANFVEEIGKTGDERARIVKEAKALVERQIALLLDQRNWPNDELLLPYDYSLMYGSILLLSNDGYFVDNFGLTKIHLELAFQIAANGIEKSMCPDCMEPVVKDGVAGTLRCPNCSLIFAEEGFYQAGMACPRACTVASPRGRRSSGTVASLSGNNPHYVRCLSCRKNYSTRPLACDLPFIDKSEKIDGGSDMVIEGDDSPEDKPQQKVKVPASLSDKHHMGHVAWLFCELMRSLDGALRVKRKSNLLDGSVSS